MPFAPPLSRAVASRIEGEDCTVRRWRCIEFIGIAVSRYLHRRAAVAADAEDVAAPQHVFATGMKVNPTPVTRPAVQLFAAIVKCEALQIATVERQYINIAIAGAG